MSQSPQALREFHVTRGLKIVIILAILGLDILFSALGKPKYSLLLLGGLAGITGFLVLTRRFEWGILAIVLTSFFGRVAIGTGSNVPLNPTIGLVAALLGLWLLHMLLVARAVELKPSRVNLPAVVFVITNTVSLVAGNVNWLLQASDRASLPAQLGGWALYVFSIALVLMVGNQVREEKTLRVLTWIFLACSGLYVVTGMIPGVAQAASKLFIDPNRYENPFGSMFWTWAAAMGYSQLLNKQLATKWRIAIGVQVLATLYIGWFVSREWISGWLPPLIAMVIITWLYSRRLGLLTLVPAAAVIIPNFSKISASVLTNTQDYSISSRQATWPILFEIIKTNPILGLGHSNYYHYTSLYSLLGWYVEFNSHNNYIDIIAQTGLVGLAVFLWFVYALFRVSFDLLKRKPEGFQLSFVLAVIGGLAATLVSGMLGDWFLPFVYNISTAGFRTSIFPWLFAGGVIFYENLARQPQTAPDFPTSTSEQATRTIVGNAK